MRSRVEYHAHTVRCGESNRRDKVNQIRYEVDGALCAILQLPAKLYLSDQTPSTDNPPQPCSPPPPAITNAPDSREESASKEARARLEHTIHLG